MVKKGSNPLPPEIQYYMKVFDRYVEFKKNRSDEEKIKRINEEIKKNAQLLKEYKKLPKEIIELIRLISQYHSERAKTNLLNLAFLKHGQEYTGVSFAEEIEIDNYVSTIMFYLDYYNIKKTYQHGLLQDARVLLNYDKESNKLKQDSNKMLNWQGTNNLQVLSLIELLETAGLIKEGSFNNAGKIINNTFLRRDNLITIDSINGKKKDVSKYLDKRLEFIKEIVNRINLAFDELENFEEEGRRPTYFG